MSLTRELREELAHADPRVGPARLAEASAMVRFGGALRLRGSGRDRQVAVVVRCAQAAVARRLRATLVEALDVRPGLAQMRGGNLAGSSGYLVEVEQATLEPLGILDLDGRPREGIDAAQAAQPKAYLAGVLMVAGRLSGAGQPVHLEVDAPGTRTAQALAAMLGVAARDTRVVLKDGDAVADLLVGVGAHTTFLAFDQGRMRRDLRRQVNRSVNADRANLRRTADAAQMQIEVIQRLVEEVGWDGMPEDLREIALVRLVNPEASLADLGLLVDPPITKASVHRRLKRLETLTAEGNDRAAQDQPGDG